MKTLIAYFSHAGENYFAGAYRSIAEGNTKVVAEMIKERLGADIFEIKTVKTYPESYKACCDEALSEQRNGELPDLKNLIENIDEYDNIVLCYPCWWGTMPQAVFTFLNTFDFSGKTIYPLCTHEGSGMGRSESDLKRTCPGANIKKGLAIQGSLVREAGDKLDGWLAEL